MPHLINEGNYYLWRQLSDTNFCHVSDSIDVTVKTSETNLYVNDIANIDNDIVITVLKLAQTIISLTNSKSNIIHLSALKEGDMTRSQLDITKMKNVIKRDLTPLKIGLQKLID